MRRRDAILLAAAVAAALALAAVLVVRSVAPGAVDRLDAGSDARMARAVHVALQVGGQRVGPGRFVVTETFLDRVLARAGQNDKDLDGLIVDLRPNRACLAVRLPVLGSAASFLCATPIVQDGRLLLTEREGGLFARYRPDAVGDAVEAELAALFARSGVVPTSVRVDEGKLTIELASDRSSPRT